MATMSMSFTVCSILALEHPNGLTLEEIYEKARKFDPSRFDGFDIVDVILGICEGVRQEYGWVTCWKEVDGKIYYDTSRRCYAHSYERYGFGTLFNDWLKNNDLGHLVLYERLNPENSEKCPFDFDWESIPDPGHCDWDYEKEECSGDCRKSRLEFEAASARIEGRNYAAHYKRPLIDGD